MMLTGCFALLADGNAYVYDVKYSGKQVYVYVKMNTQAQKEYKSVRVKVEPTRAAKRLFDNGVYKYADIIGNQQGCVMFECTDDAAANCGVADYWVTTVDYIEK